MSGHRWLRSVISWIVALGLCGAVRVGAQEPQYPRWFVEGVEDDGLTVGYSTAFHHPDSSMAYALRDGAGSIVKARGLRIRSEEGFARVAGGLRFMGRIVHEEVDSSEVETVMAQAQAVDTITVGRSYIVLVAIGEEIPSVDTARGPMSGKRPGWADAPPTGKKAVYAVGVARRYHYEHHSWQEAERVARLELARTVLARVRHVSKRADGSLESVIVSETDVVLRSVRIVKRWLDREGNVCYVLARMPVR